MTDQVGFQAHCRAGGIAVVVRDDLVRTSTSMPYIINDLLGGKEALWVWDQDPARLNNFLASQRNYLDRSEVSPEGLSFQAVYGWCALRALLLCTLGRLIDRPRG